jgi:membrane protease YdiL (CAAX protease family)
MVAENPHSQSPASREANLCIILMLLAVLGVLYGRTHLLQKQPNLMAVRISAQGRIQELQHSIREFTHTSVRTMLPRAPAVIAVSNRQPSWDSALMAILAAEQDDQAAADVWLASAPSGEPGAAFRRCFRAAYRGVPTPPSPSDRSTVKQALRSGYAALLLEARLQSEASSAQSLRNTAREWAFPRLMALATAGLAFLLMVPGGIAVGVLLAFQPRGQGKAPLPQVRLSGQGMALVLLGWFLAFLLSGTLFAPLVSAVPFLHPFLIPLTYGFHAIIGLGLLCRIEGMTIGDLRKRWLPRTHGRSLAWGLGFLALATVMVLTVTLLAGPLLERQEAPQQQLMDLVTDTRGILPLTSLFLTVSLVAPLFEEGLFRGTLLPWLGERWQGALGPSLGWASALVTTSVGFGVIHLQPVAVPVLSTLGIALGLAYRHTGNLLTAVLVHSLWNGGVFLFYRLVLG